MKLSPKVLYAILVFVPSFLFSIMLALGIGSSRIDIFNIFHPDDVLLSLRWPRVYLGGLVGAVLASSGVVLQALLQNPLADPYSMGVSGGAALGGVLALLLGLSQPWAVPSFAFLGALLSLFILLVFSWHWGKAHTTTLVLAGVAINALASALVTVCKVLAEPNQAQGILFWLLGSLSPLLPVSLTFLSVYVGLGLLLLMLSAGALNLLALGDEQALALGLSVRLCRILLFTLTAFLVAAVVSTSGMIGFVGLIIPHVVRAFVGADHRWLLPLSALAGALTLILADTASRFTFYRWGSEIPLGAITALLGAPCFMVLLLKQSRI